MNVAVTINNRKAANGADFAEVHYTWKEGGAVRYALTRYWHPVPNTPHQREIEARGFVARREAK